MRDDVRGGAAAGVLDEASAMKQQLVDVRRDLHRHPELGFDVHRTAGVVADRLSALGLEPRRGVGISGVVAELDNGSGPTIALRADMDALPIQEEGTHDYLSTVPGVMHACGHDAHTSSLLGAAALLVARQRRGELPNGRVRFLFQPSEEGNDAEGKSGAVRMIEDGAMKGVDAVVGMHVWGHLPSGQLLVGPGPVMAGSEEIHVEVLGKSSHAARPEEGIDALVLAAQGLLSVQQAVSRRISPMDQGVVSFGRMEGGTAGNVLADRVTLRGTLRYFEERVRERLIDAVSGAFHSLEGLGAKVNVGFGPGYVPVVNDAGVAAVLQRALGPVTPSGQVAAQPPMMTAEDFAFLAREAPGTFLWLGVGLPEGRENHHPRFDVDENALPVAVAALATSAIALMEERAG